MKILVPIDFSPASKNALDYAACIARKTDAKLLLHYTIQDHDSIAEDLSKINEDTAKRFMDDLIAEYCAGIEYQTNFLTGSIVYNIQKLVERSHTDLIVMGTQGVSNGIKEVFIGSNTNDVIEANHTPVLVVPEFADAPKFDKIVLSTDYHFIEDSNAFDMLETISEAFDSHIYFVHVKQKNKRGTAEVFMEQRREKHILEQKAKVHFRTIFNDDPIDGLEFYLNMKGNTDLVVMLKRKHNIWEKIFKSSHTKQMVFHSHLPLLILHETMG
jgi:nucleotide-binding universal stress UspA family protein